jgi:GntR family transcriptional regulator/MocR family aminotransferase
VTNSWSSSGLDLHLDRTGRGVRAGLEAAIRTAVADGRLAPGTRLPSSRSLAGDLGVARNTVAQAYGLLVAEGWLTARAGSATVVAEHAAELRPHPIRRAADAPPPFDLRPGLPDTTAFPRRAWLAAARRAIGRAGPEAFGYPDPRGLAALRDELARYLARARGVRTNPDRIVICSGYSQGLFLLARVLAARGGRAVAIEAFGHQAHRSVLERSGLRVEAVPVDAGGAVVPALAELDVAAAVVSPAHQFPLGVPLDPGRRSALVRWAAGCGAVVLEDDYDGEFRYDRTSIGALQPLAPERVVYAGTASKTLAPGLRLGWLVLPADLVADVVAAKAEVEWMTSAIDQLTLAELIAAGAYDAHIRRRRHEYRRRRTLLAQALATAPTPTTMAGVAAGLHALVHPAEGDEQAIVDRAASHGLALQGLSAFTGDGAAHEPGLVVGFATPPEHAYAGALERLLRSLAVEQ